MMDNTVNIDFFCVGCGNEVKVTAESSVNIWRVEPCEKCLKESFLSGYNKKVNKEAPDADANDAD